MMASIARVSLRRKNNLNPRLFRHQPPSPTAWSPRGISTCYFGDPESCPLPFVFSDKNGPLPFNSATGESMMMRLKQAKHPSYADSSDEEGEAAGEGQLQQRSGAKQEDDALYFKIDMPGVSKEDAKVYLDGNILIAKGSRKLDPQFEAAKDDDESSFPMTYSAGVSLVPMRKYKVSGIKAEMKDGVLKVTVPKVKDEERTDVLHVQID